MFLLQGPDGAGYDSQISSNINKNMIQVTTGVTQYPYYRFKLNQVILFYMCNLQVVFQNTLV